MRDDLTCKCARLEPTLLKYQTPNEVDKVMRVDKQLSETKEVLYKTIDAVLARGEKLGRTRRARRSSIAARATRGARRTGAGST